MIIKILSRYKTLSLSLHRAIINGRNQHLSNSFNCNGKQSLSNSSIDKIIRFRKMEGDIKTRTDPIVVKLDTPEFKSIFTDELYELIDLFKKYGYEIRIAGGAVRDILMNIKPKDVDFATTATPTQMKDMFNKEEIRLINMKGEKHGTITARIKNKENFEITTLRIDAITDGRHAEVIFTTDWQLDANRRDLTINSMFMAFDGSVYDYFFGYEDLNRRRVVFVGNADTRIKEDYLRILRYFRFYGRIAENPDCHDKVTLDAITDNASGLKKISGERIWSEIKRLLEGKFAYELLIKMMECGLAEYIGLPQNPNITEFTHVCKYNENYEKPLYPITFIISLLNNYEDAIRLHERLKLSAYERDLAFFITQNRDELKDKNDLLVFQKLCLNPNCKREYVEEYLKYSGKNDLFNLIKSWEIPHFPINGNNLRENGCPQGKAIGYAMTQLKAAWANENFKPSFEVLLKDYLPKILEGLQANTKRPKKMKLQK